MKRLLCLFLLIACGLVLISCSNECAHIDNDGDLKCDLCEAEVPCTSHKDKDKNLKCDKCDAPVQCTHQDLDNDGACDIEACDYVFCEHEYSETYSHNKTSHYFLPLCNCNIDPKDEAPHADLNNDGNCDVCKWDYNHRHTYDTTYTYDATNHWFVSTCGHDVKKDVAPHTDKTNDGICDVCFWDYDHEHVYAEIWTIDETEHWREPTCGHTVAVKDNGAHKDNDNDGLCDVCSWDYEHVHTYETNAWTKNEEKHWHAANCGHNTPGIDISNHIDEDDNGECDTCEYNMCGPDHRIDEGNWQWNEEKHWQPSVCGHDTPSCTMEAQGHQWDDEGIVCTMCNYNNGHQHEFDETVFESDANGHWHRYTCHSDYISAVAAHVDEIGNDGLCDVCNYQICNHEFDDTKWVYEEGGTTHWHPITCTHAVEVTKKDEAAHIDEVGNDGICDVCNYQICNHPQLENEYDHDENYHWNKLAECNHEVPAEKKTLHTDCDEDADGICDICKTTFCSHPQSETEYEKDATHHWLKFTECNHVVPVERKALHQDDDNDGVCEVCGVYCTHTYDTENWSTDSESHYHAVTCGHNVPAIDIIKHADADTNNDGICETCGYVYCTHTWATEWSSDASNHWYAVTCGHNTDVKDLAAHVDEIGNDGICDVCQYVLCEHTYDIESGYVTDKNCHWYAITCGHNLPESAKLPHDDEDGDGYCTTCKTQFCDHEYDKSTYVYDGTNHWYNTTCGHPVPETTKQPHVDINNDGYCEVCNNQYCVHGEEDTTVLDYNDTHHWNKYTECGHIDLSTKAEHIDSDKNNVCDVCGKNFVSDDLDVDTNDPFETPKLEFNP